MLRLVLILVVLSVLTLVLRNTQPKIRSKVLREAAIVGTVVSFALSLIVLGAVITIGVFL